MPDENLNELTTWYVFKQSRSEFYSLLVNAVGQHGRDALLGLAEALEEEWTDARSRGAWPIDERRNVILAFVRSDFSKFWATSRLQELDELVISTSDAAEVGERVNYCMRQAEAWLELFNKDRAQHFLDLALDVGYGIGYRKDYQLNRWIEWLGEINRIQPDEASSRLTRLAYAIEGLDDSTEGRATALAAEELLAVTFNWSPTRATKLLCWFLDRGLIGYKDGVGILIREALKSPNCPVQTVIQVFVELLLPFDKEGDSELIESILQHVVRIQGSDRFLEVAKHIALKTQILSIPQARGAWIKGLIRASEEMGFNSSILAIDLDGIKFAEEDTRNSKFLHLKGVSEEMELEEVQKKVSSISDVRNLLNMEDKSSYFDWTPVVERLIAEAVDEESTFEFAELFRCDRYHATDVLSAICRHLNQIGSHQKAWDAGVEALEKASPFGWNPWFDGGAKYGAFRALGQIDKNKTVSLTYQTLVKDLEENRSFSEAAAGLNEILELITCTLDVPAIWTEVEEHAEFLLLGGIASDLPNLFEEQREDTPQRALQTCLMEFFCHPIRAVSHGAQRAIGTLILENPNDLASILSQNLQKSECHQERILALLDSVDRTGSSPVTQFRSEVEALAESPNWAIRRIAESITETHGWNSKPQQMNFRQLPWMHNLTITRQTITISDAESRSNPGGPLRDSEDIDLAISNLFGNEMSLLGETSGLSAESIQRRIVALIHDFDQDQSELTAQAERRLGNTLRSVGLWTSFVRPRARLALRAFFHTVGELQDAGRLHPQVSQILKSWTRSYDPELTLIAPTKKPAEIPAMEEMSYDADKKAWVRDVQTALKHTTWEPDEGGVVIAEKTILRNHGDWESPTENRYSLIVLADSADLFTKPSMDTFFESTVMATISDYQEASVEPAEVSLALLNAPRSIDSPGADWLAFDPLIASEIGWTQASEGLFRWIDPDRRIMVESMWWANGLPALRTLGSDKEAVSEGWVVLATQEALDALRSHFGSLFRVSLVHREICNEDRSFEESAFEIYAI